MDKYRDTRISAEPQKNIEPALNQTLVSEHGHMSLTVSGKVSLIYEINQTKSRARTAQEI